MAADNTKPCVSNVDLLNNAVDYFTRAVNEFINIEESHIMDYNGRLIYAGETAKERLSVRQMCPKQFLQDIFNSDLNIVIMGWQETRASFDDTHPQPFLFIKNWFVWSDLSTSYIYLIDEDEAFFDIVTPEVRDSVIHWAKECSRYIDNSCGAEIKTWLSTKTNEPVNRYGAYIKSKDCIISDLISVLGDIAPTVEDHLEARLRERNTSSAKNIVINSGSSAD